MFLSLSSGTKNLKVIKKTIIIIGILSCFLACKKDSSMAPMQGTIDDASFNAYEQKFLDDFWKLNPDWATSVGYHKYDSILLVPNKQNREKLLKFVKVQIDSLGRYNPSGFLQTNKMDHAIIENEMNAIQ